MCEVCGDQVKQFLKLFVPRISNQTLSPQFGKEPSILGNKVLENHSHPLSQSLVFVFLTHGTQTIQIVHHPLADHAPLRDAQVVQLCVPRKNTFSHELEQHFQHVHVLLAGFPPSVGVTLLLGN